MSKHKVVAIVEEHFWLAGATKDEKEMILEGVEESITDELHDWWQRKKNAKKPFALIVSFTEVAR